MNIVDLILDIKIYIALFDENVWIKMVLYDKEFFRYAYKEKALKQFVDNFHQTIDNKTYLFGKLHSINDKPILKGIADKYWYYNGLIHRDMDLPAIIDNTGAKCWYLYGKRQRVADLPAIVQGNGTKFWYYNNNIHRENDLPAIIYTSGTKCWYNNGKSQKENGLPTIIQYIYS